MRKQTGNMYSFVSHTWNPIKGKCRHNCSYCYMKRFPLGKVRLDDKELKTDLGRGNFVFIGSGTDMFASDVPGMWVDKVLEHCKKHPDNRYLFQTKDPYCFEFYKFPMNTFLATTIETNRWYPDIMNSAPHPHARVAGMKFIENAVVTIEPIMDFDFGEFSKMIFDICPKWVNIGADSGNNNLPEPSAEKVGKLVEFLSTFTKVKLKDNLKRVYENRGEL